MESSGTHSGSTKSSGGSSHWFTKAILKYARLLPCDTMLLHLFHKFKTHYINGVHFSDQQQRRSRARWRAPDMTQQCPCLRPNVGGEKRLPPFSMADETFVSLKEISLEIRLKPLPFCFQLYGLDMELLNSEGRSEASIMCPSVHLFSGQFVSKWWAQAHYPVPLNNCLFTHSVQDFSVV